MSRGVRALQSERRVRASKTLRQNAPGCQEKERPVQCGLKVGLAISHDKNLVIDEPSLLNLAAQRHPEPTMSLSHYAIFRILPQLMCNVWTDSGLCPMAWHSGVTCIVPSKTVVGFMSSSTIFFFCFRFL